MGEEKKKSPVLNFADLPRTGDPIKIKLNCSESIASGKANGSDSTSWNWYLWSGEVKNALVWEGRGENKKAIKDYTGEVIFFPSEKLNETLKQLAAGRKGVIVEVWKERHTNKLGKSFTSYSSRVVGFAEEANSDITETEQKLLDDANILIESGVEFAEEVFVTTSQTKQYEGKISKERAKELYKLLKK